MHMRCCWALDAKHTFIMLSRVMFLDVLAEQACKRCSTSMCVRTVCVHYVEYDLHGCCQYMLWSSIPLHINVQHCMRMWHGCCFPKLDSLSHTDAKPAWHDLMVVNTIPHGFPAYMCSKHHLKSLLTHTMRWVSMGSCHGQWCCSFSPCCTCIHTT